MRYSLRSGLISLGLLLTLIAVGLAAVLLGVWRQGMDALVQQASARVRTSCEVIIDRLRQVDAAGRLTVSPADDRATRDLVFLLDVVLTNFDGVEGGIWTKEGGFVAYAFPTYLGSATKRDVPEAERPWIVTTASRALATNQSDTLREDGTRESLILHVCPVKSPIGAVAWTMIRVPVGAGAAHETLLLGLGALFVLELGSGVWVFVLVRRWSHRVNHLAAAIADSSTETLPVLPPVEEQDLNRIVTAINQLSARLSAARDTSNDLTQKLAQADRLAALGRMAAVLAHEIRTPLGTIRLKAENALASTEADHQRSWQAVLQQVERLNSLLHRLMAIVQPLDPHPEPVCVRDWLRDRVDQFRDLAEQRGIALKWEAPDEQAVFDAPSLGRALDNLLLNAVQHTPRSGTIAARAVRDDGRLVLSVDDSGPGVTADMRERVFEPFTTTRADGTGLGLAIVREIVEAQGGTVHCIDASTGARFQLELPWRAS